MKTVTQHLRDHLLAEAGLDVIQRLQRSEWSTEFEQRMRNRLVMGALRYGRLRDPSSGYDTIGTIVKRAELYRETGNQKLLVDVANLALVEYVRPSCHPNLTLAPSDDGTHVW